MSIGNKYTPSKSYTPKNARKKGILYVIRCPGFSNSNTMTTELDMSYLSHNH
jgi:hypothetical protein